MDEIKYFLHQVKHTDGVYDKGIVVKDTLEAAEQGYHSYLGAYAYGQHQATDFVSVMITDSNGATWMTESWKKKATPEPTEE